MANQVGVYAADAHDASAHDQADRAVNEDILGMDMVMCNGYRYIPLHSMADCRLKWPIPGRVTLSPHDRSRDVILRNKCRTLLHRDRVAGGYRSAMATHGLAHGTAYFEALLESPNVRIGVAQLTAPLGGPVGMDRFGYAVTDSGHVVHDAFKSSFMDSPLPANTIVGFLVHIPKHATDRLYSEQVAFEHCKRPFLQCKLAIPPKHPAVMHGSNVKVFVDGEEAGVAFTGLHQAPSYFPMFSVFRGGKVTVNFGPEFVFPPRGRYRPWSDLYHN